MTRLFSNAFAKFFLLLLLTQQGLGSIALAAVEAMQDAHNGAAPASVHDCADMLKQDTGATASNAVTQKNPKHDHQDCADMGCDNCVGCAVCAINYRNSPNLYIRALPMLVSVTIATPSPQAERLYRPPIFV